MQPRFEPGELVYATSSRPARIGGYVVVVLKAANPGGPQVCHLLRLVEIGEDEIVCEQLSPHRPHTFPAATIDRIDRVLTTNELAGV